MPDNNRPSAGDAAQVRLIVEQVVDAAIVRLSAPQTAKIESHHKPEIPGSLKTAGAILTAILTAGIVGLTLWIVSTLNDMQVTVARIDERQQSQAGDLDGRFAEVNRRLARVEAVVGETRDREGDGK